MIRTLLRLLTLIALAATPATALPPPWTPIGPFGGVVQSLTADPKHPGTVYALTGNAIFKTVDGGASWKTIYTGTPNSNLAIDPIHPETLFVAVYGPVLIKSTDGGAHWTPSAGGLIPDPVFVPRIVAVSPGASLLLLSYGQGLWRSTDAGVSWQPANAGLPGGANNIVEGIAISSSAALVVTPGGVYRSADAGRSWAPVGDELPTAPSGALAVSPTDPRIVYASFPGEGLYRSRDGGISWSQVSGPENAYPGLTVSAQSPRTLYAISDGRPVRSWDSGAHWTLLDGGFPQIPRVLDLAADSRGTVYAGTAGLPGGVFRSDDAGSTWTRRIQGLTALAVTSVAVDPADPDRIWTAGNSVYRTANGGVRWARVPDPAVTVKARSLAIGAGSQVFAEASAYRTGEESLWTTLDNGASWKLLLGSPRVGEVSAFRVAPSSLSTIYLAGYDTSRKVEVLRSTDRGATWQERSSGAALPGCGITDLAVAPSDAEVVYISGGQFDPLIRACRPAVIRSGDGGATWSSLAVGPPVGTVGGLAVDPRDPDTVYARTGGPVTPGDGVWKSSDGGRTWSQAGSEFATRTVTALLASAVPGRVYAATLDGRVFRSDDGGASWRGWSRTLRTNLIFALVADPRDPHRIYAATANAVWRLDERD